MKRAFEILEPVRQSVPVVFASPHSGSDYPDPFVRASPLDRLQLRRSEDSFVDEIFWGAPARGAPLIRALFPRAFVDPNREPFELDPLMFEDDLPPFANTRSPRVAAGLGTIARVVANGAEIYGSKLRYADAAQRIERCYRPYHAALAGLIERTRAAFGYCILVDCHSMPSVGGPLEKDAGESRVDMVLGDCFATACAPVVTTVVERFLVGCGYVVTRNDPYAGGFTTRHYGRPLDRVHALQIEINRGLYMDEARIEKLPALGDLASRVGGLIDALAAIPRGPLAGGG